MASRPTNAKDLRAALTRITGSPGRNSEHNVIFRVEVTSSDGHFCPVMIRIGKKTFFPTTSINQVADCLRVPRDEVDRVWDWRPEDVVRHLSQFSAEILTSSAQHRRFETG